MNDKKCVLDVHKYKPLSWKKFLGKNYTQRMFSEYIHAFIYIHNKKNKYINNIKLLCR